MRLNILYSGRMILGVIKYRQKRFISYVSLSIILTANWLSAEESSELLHHEMVNVGGAYMTIIGKILSKSPLRICLSSIKFETDGLQELF